MEKTIKLVIQDDKSIEVFVNDFKRMTISERARSISAQEIYDLIEYSIGDVLSVETKNDNNIDEKVMLFFEELIKGVCDGINSLSLSEENPLN